MALTRLHPLPGPLTRKAVAAADMLEPTKMSHRGSRGWSCRWRSIHYQKRGGLPPRSSPMICACYCFSYTLTSLICCPFALTPMVVKVKVLPSADNARVVVWITFPAFVRVISVVESFTCL
jgi:hypothetical protein